MVPSVAPGKGVGTGGGVWALAPGETTNRNKKTITKLINHKPHERDEHVF
jgi:hypothetical protein